MVSTSLRFYLLGQFIDLCQSKVRCSPFDGMGRIDRLQALSFFNGGSGDRFRSEALVSRKSSINSKNSSSSISK